MAHTVPVEDEDYDSAADSDFEAPASASSGDESDNSKADGQDKKRKQDADGDLAMGSGDEGVVAEGKKARKRQKKKAKSKGKGKKNDTGDANDTDENDDNDGEGERDGIRVKLRSGRGGAVSKDISSHKKSKATANIDEVWARMNDPQLQRLNEPASEPPLEPSKDSLSASKNSLPSLLTTIDIHQDPLSISEETVSIPHSYVFAGQTHTSTKFVPRSSPAAQAYLTSKKESKSADKSTYKINSPSDNSLSPSNGPALRRPLARRGLLQPNTSQHISSRNIDLPVRSDLPASIGGSRILDEFANRKSNISGKENLSSAGTRNKEKHEKLNTVEKSKLDWEAEVRRLGIQEELQKAAKSGANYLSRQDFLDKVEDAREQIGRKARLSGLGT